MNWESIAAVAELLGAIGVILSLMYLATQIRITREADRKSNLQALFQSFGAFRRTIFENAEVSRIYLQGIHNPEDLSEQDLFRFFVMLEEMFLSMEGYWAQQDPTVNDPRLQRILRIAAEMRSTAGGAMFWAHGQSQSLMPAFRDAVENADGLEPTGFSYRDE